MKDKTKLTLIYAIVGDAFEWSGDSTSRIGFLEGTLSAISVVVNFEEGEHESDTAV